MSYGCGTVGLPLLGRALIFFMAAETTYISYQLFVKPGIPRVLKYFGLTDKKK